MRKRYVILTLRLSPIPSRKEGLSLSLRLNNVSHTGRKSLKNDPGVGRKAGNGTSAVPSKESHRVFLLDRKSRAIELHIELQAQIQGNILSRRVVQIALF